MSSVAGRAPRRIEVIVTVTAQERGHRAASKSRAATGEMDTTVATAKEEGESTAAGSEPDSNDSGRGD